ncbi:MAG TPA: hypothetical protein ACFCUD_15030 [Cyclobacteriaceae bacterium]
MSIQFSNIRYFFILLLLSAIIGACGSLKKLHYNRHREVILSNSIPEIDKTRDVKILTAFFGLDNGLPNLSRFLYKNAPGQDGMPVVFSHELEPSTVDASDFEVVTKNGIEFKIEAFTFVPAEEAYELRTLLLIGEYGNHPDNPPIELKVVGDLMTRTGVNYKGQSKEIIPLLEGPILSYAEYFTFDNDYPYLAKGFGCDCPKETTKTVVKAVWAGGVRAVNGEELGDNELSAFEITLVQEMDTLTVTPFQLADLSDNDNNIDLCLKEDGTPIKLVVKENTAIDPRDDKNPRTEIEIVSRW